MIARARQDEPLDLLCWRVLGRTAGVVEAALGLNPGIDRHVLLQAGRRVRLPDAPAAPVRRLIQLWN
jgi:phage tail protein X